MIRWRWAVLLGVLVATIVAVAGARHLVFVTDYKYYFGPDNPQLTDYVAVQETYTKSDTVVFVLEPTRVRCSRTRCWQPVLMMTEQAWQLPYSVRVDSITNFQYTRAEADDLIVEDLVADGATEHIADQLADWIDGGVDGFNLSYATLPSSFEDFVDGTVPVLQRRGRMQTEYRPGSLREKLFDGRDAHVAPSHPAAACRRPWPLSNSAG